MSTSHAHLDPRLGASPDNSSPNGNADGRPYQSSTPYFYPSPQQTGLNSEAQTSAPNATAERYQTAGRGSIDHSTDTPVANTEAAEGAEGAEEGGDEDSKRPRACEACRGLKVRCDQDPAHPEIPCKRCAKAGRHCVITQPTRKRQRKGVGDTRVAELERKLDALTEALRGQQQGPGGDAEVRRSVGQGNDISPVEVRYSGLGTSSGRPWRDGSAAYASTTSGDAMLPPHKRRRIDGSFPESISFDGAEEQTRNRLAQSNNLAPPPLINRSGSPLADLTRYLPYTSPQAFKNRINSLINPEMASSIFDRYTNKLAPHLPAVVFPTGTTAAQIFNEKPILYTCILSAASHGLLSSEVSTSLAREAVGAIADGVVRNGAKSLELIQAMQVTALWYRPPEKAEQTNFYQIIHMAAVMALDIGLGKRFNPAKARRGFGGPNAQFVPGPTRMLPQDSDTLEARRAWLGCYYLCASASMVLRRPNLVRWTNYMKESIEVLESHPDAYASDKLFCQHIKIQHICEEIGLQFLMDDNTATNISLKDPKVSYALNVLEGQLRSWKEQIPVDFRESPSLRFFEHVTALYLHEIALHFNHNIEDFRLPFTEESLKSVGGSSDALTQNQMAALEACLRAAHGILDIMLEFDGATLKTLPMLLFFVRCTYAIVVLIKMHVAVSVPGSELGKVMKPEDMKVEYYMGSLMTLFAGGQNNEGAENGGRPHPKILMIWGVLRDWFEKHKEGLTRGDRDDDDKMQSSGASKADDSTQQQTGLQLLSQVATGDRQQTSQQQQQQPTLPSVSAGENMQSGDWTVQSPYIFDHYANRALNGANTMIPSDRQNQQPQPTQAAFSDTMPPSTSAEYQSLGLDDPMPMDFSGWGTNFEQAMDMALGGMDGLHAGGLDGWFLGTEAMAPFGFSGETGGSANGEGGVGQGW